MAGISIQLFGPVVVTAPGRAGDLGLGPAGLGLCAYLALAPGDLTSREQIAADLWPEAETERARSRLATLVWRVRGALERAGAGAALVAGPGGSLGLCAETRAGVDARRFQTRAAAFLSGPEPETGDLAHLSADLTRPRRAGPPLAGIYDAWALRARIRLEDLEERCLTRLLELCLSRTALDEALGLAAELLEIDPLREDVHRAVIGVHMARGRRALAIRQFERCRAVLMAELGLKPQAETRALLDEPAPRPGAGAVWAGAPAGTSAGDPVGGPVGGPWAPPAETELSALQLAIDDAKRGLARLARQIDALTRH